MSSLSQKFAQKAAAREREEEQEHCLHDDIQRLDSRNGRCLMCGATFDDMDSWDEEEED